MEINPDRVPSSLAAAVQMLTESLTEDDISYIKGSDSGEQHHFFGRNLRNEWSLWEQDTPLVLWFNHNLKIGHADDISGIILAAFWAKVKDEGFDLQKLVKEYHAHWEAQGIDPVTGKDLKGDNDRNA